MASVKATALKDFKFKGKQINKGDELTMSTHAASTYANVGFVKLDSAAKEKVEMPLEKEKRIVTPQEKKHK